MSHIPQREEKDCLNCGAIVQGRYCQVCGQENVIPREGFWHMVTHFFYDLTHFDSNFFHTVKWLIFRPGFLSKEYITGRRASYLHPIRMYVFTSAMFFLLFFSLFKVNQVSLQNPISAKQRPAVIKSIEKQINNDTANKKWKALLIKAKDSTKVLTQADLLGIDDDSDLLTFGNRRYHSVREYDSIQSLLSPEKKDGWLNRRIYRKSIAMFEKYHGDKQEIATKISENFFHRLPYLLFVSLPLFAFLLKLVYIRRRKQFYYGDHGVFTLHFYIFSFIILMAIFGINALNNITGWGLLYIPIVLLFLSLFFYLYKAMRNFYGQRRLKTFVKFGMVALFSIIMMLVLFVIFFFFSAVTV